MLAPARAPSLYYAPLHKESRPSGLGVAALARAREQLAAGVWEPGQYLAPCVRAGERMGLETGPWNVAFACWCAWMAWASGRTQDPLPDILAWPNPMHPWDLPPICYRATAAELVADARGSGAWFDVSAMKSGHAILEPGDIAVFSKPKPVQPRLMHGTHARSVMEEMCHAETKRYEQDPRTGGDGRVAIVESVSTGGLSFVCIAGDAEGGAVVRETRTLHDTVEPLVGWVSLGGA